MFDVKLTPGIKRLLFNLDKLVKQNNISIIIVADT